MKYIYDITLNLRSNLINFYEWSETDDINIYKKIPLFKVDDEQFKQIVNMSVKVSNDFLSSIYIDNNYICIFTTAYDSIACSFNKCGYIDKISKLMLIDEEYLLNTTHNIKKDCIKYSTVDGSNNYSFKTRNENNLLIEIEKYILKNKENKVEIEYLFMDMYNKKSNNYIELINLLKKEKQNRLEYLFKTIEILKINV